LIGVKFLTMWLNFESTRKVVPQFMIIGKVAGIDVITIARIKACGVNLFHLVSWIAAIANLYFLSSLIVIRRPPGLYSDRSF
jgi:hypothetical protein